MSGLGRKATVAGPRKSSLRADVVPAPLAPPPASGGSGAVVAGRQVAGVGLGVLLRTADMAFNRALRDSLARSNVTFSQFQHLWQLFESDALSQAELSRRIGIETASSTGVIEQLERRGLIRRVRDPSDRRRIIVTLTDAGRRLEKPLTDSAVAVNAVARAAISDHEVKLLHGIIERIVKNLRNHAAESGPAKGKSRGKS